ncbi:MAG: type IV pilus assembly protein PilY1 [Halioglobus sp.]|jgi:type IV pilus assembly protein PilY1
MNHIKLYLFLIACVCGGNSSADDIDILVRDVTPNSAPYMHVVLDSSATAFQTLCTYGVNGSCAPPFMTAETYKYLRVGHREGDEVSRFEVFSAVLSQLFQRSEFSSLSVSLLISDKDYGARVLSTYKRLGDDYAGISGAILLIDKLASLSVEPSSAQRHNFNAKDAFYIWYRYINTTGDMAPDFDSCSRFFSVLMATESSVEDNLMSLDIAQALGISTKGDASFAGLLSQIHDSSSNLVSALGERVNFLDTTWVVSPKDNADLQQQWAEAGGSGRSLNIDNPGDLERSLGIAFSKAVNSGSTVVSPWAPISSLVVDSLSGEVFASVFQPGTTIRWQGNIKKYKLGNIQVAPQASVNNHILDARGSQAIVSGGVDKGRIRFDALSYWTRVSELPIKPDLEAPRGADGRVVTRGGAGQKIPGYVGSDGMIGDNNSDAGARQLFIEPETASNGSPDSLIALDVGNARATSRLASTPGVSTAAEANELIRWARGQDIDDEDGDQILSEARPWILGSSIHSRPAVLNYGAVGGYSTEHPNIRVFVGSGDGAFHGFENITPSGSESGREIFAFLPDESLLNLKLLREDKTSSTKMRYGVDGGVALLAVDKNRNGNLDWEGPEADAAYVYFGMRRGGSSYYALDVSNPEVPPALQWKVSRLGLADVAGDFAELGLSFSKPLVGKVKYDDSALDVVIFAGGYHGGWDTDYENRIGKDLSSANDVVETTGGSVSTGNAIYIVNAVTGELVWKAVYGPSTDTARSSSNTRFEHAELVDSIPSTVSALKNSAGIIDRLYVGDTGGAVWRVDLPAANTSNAKHRKEHWFVSKLAELGSNGQAGDRRFFHGPDILRSKENDGRQFDGILISSGNRADPNSTYAEDYLFYLKDHSIVSGDDTVRLRPAFQVTGGASAFVLADRTPCIKGGGLDVEPRCNVSLENGWMIRLVKPGEKSLSSPLVDGGRVFFTSYVPPIFDACTISPGEAYVYVVNLEDASGVSPSGRIFSLGKGIPSAVLALSDSVLLPLGGNENAQEISCEGKACQRNSRQLHKIYWREPGIDEQ